MNQSRCKKEIIANDKTAKKLFVLNDKMPSKYQPIIVKNNRIIENQFI
jgi:hypothetical protein